MENILIGGIVSTKNVNEVLEAGISTQDKPLKAGLAVQYNAQGALVPFDATGRFAGVITSSINQYRAVEAFTVDSTITVPFATQGQRIVLAAEGIKKGSAIYPNATGVFEAATASYCGFALSDTYDFNGVKVVNIDFSIAVSGGGAAPDLSSYAKKTEVEAVDTKVTANTADIATAKTDIATNTTAIETNKTSIGTNTEELANHETRIAKLEGAKSNSATNQKLPNA